jgi:predicted transposase YdaD
MQNRDAITMLEEQLANSPHIHNELLDNPFYIRWTEKGEARGEARGRKEARTESALNLMGNMGVDAERAADLLGFSSEERAALLEHIAKMADANNGKAQA